MDETPEGTRMTMITVGQENGADIRLYVEDHGAGSPVVLIHGYPLNGASWEKQSAALLAAGHRVITYDRRGFGASDKAATGHDYDTYAADLHAILEALDLHDVALVGFSMGTGEVVRYLARHGSDRVRAAALLGGIAPHLLQTEDDPDGVPQEVFDGLIAAARDDRFAFVSSFLDTFFAVDENLGDRISEQALAAFRAVGAQASPLATVDAIPAWLEDFRADVAAIDVPTLILHGTADANVPIEHSSRRLRTLLPDAQYVELEGAPHGMLWTHADQVNEVLLPFVAP